MRTDQDEDIFLRNSGYWLFDKVEERFFKYRDLDIGALLYYFLNAYFLTLRFWYHGWWNENFWVTKLLQRI